MAAKPHQGVMVIRKVTQGHMQPFLCRSPFLCMSPVWLNLVAGRVATSHISLNFLCPEKANFTHFATIVIFWCSHLKASVQMNPVK